jgi:hypothetical protein
MFVEAAKRLIDDDDDTSSCGSCMSVISINDELGFCRSAAGVRGPSESGGTADGWQSLSVPPDVLSASRWDAGRIRRIGSLTGSGCGESKMLSLTAAELAQTREPVAHVRSAVMSCLERLQIAHHVDVACCAESIYTIDAAPVSQTSERVAILVDGPLHEPCFLRTRDRLLRALGWTLVRVHLFEWSQLRDPTEEDTYLSQRLRGLGGLTSANGLPRTKSFDG